MLETLDYTIRIGSTPTFLYFDLYLYSLYTHYVYFKVNISSLSSNVNTLIAYMQVWLQDVEIK